MLKRSNKKRTVSFFRVNDADGNPIRKALPWQNVLEHLLAQDPDKRRQSISGVYHWGQSYSYQQELSLVFARLRDEAISHYDTSADQIVDVEADTQKPWVEISVVHFLPTTNFLGFILGSQAAPRVSSLEAWINRQDFFGGRDITISPVVSTQVLSKINGAAEARMLRLVLTSEQLNSIHPDGGIFGAARTLTESHGNVEVELVVRVRGRVKDDHSNEGLRILESAKSVLGTDFKKALVELVSFDDHGRYDRESVDFVNHRLAKKMNVTVTDEKGNPVRIQSALDAIYRAADRFRDELRS